MPDEIRRPGDTVSTPEGDNEFAPDQPLTPADVEADVESLQRWPSNSGMEADKKAPAAEKNPEDHDSLRYVLDEIVTGKILP